MKDFYQQAKKFFEENPGSDCFMVVDMDDPMESIFLSRDAFKNYEEYSKNNFLEPYFESFIDKGNTEIVVANSISIADIEKGIRQIVKDRLPTYLESRTISESQAKTISESIKSIVQPYTNSNEPE